MGPLWITVAFALGFGVRQIGLPPLVGFPAAGFVLQATGLMSEPTVEEIAEHNAADGSMLDRLADFGVTLLLFSISLKLRIRNLLKPEVWGPYRKFGPRCAARTYAPHPFMPAALPCCLT